MRHRDEKGTDVSHIEPPLKTYPARDIFGTLRACLYAREGGVIDVVRWLFVASFGVLTTMLLVASPTLAARGHVFASTFSEAGSGNGQLDEPSGVAVSEATDVVYVVDKGNNRVEYFDGATGVYAGQFNGEAVPTTGRFNKPEGIAIDNDPSSPSFGDVYIVDTGHSVIDKFSLTGAYIGQLTTANGINFKELEGVAVDMSGTVWVEQVPPGQENGDGVIDNFTSTLTNEFIMEIHIPFFLNFPSPGLAIDSHQDFYIRRGESSNPQVVKIDGDRNHLNDGLDNKEATDVAVELASNNVYVDNITTVDVFNSSGSPLELLGAEHGVQHLTSGSGIGVSSAAHTVYVADSVADDIVVFGPEPPGPPTVQADSEVVSDVGTTSAGFTAEVNPRSEPNEAPTEYRFQYGRCATLATCAASSYESSVPAPSGKLAANYEPDIVSALAHDLQPGRIYHYSVVVTNSFGTTQGEERTFTTQTTGSFALPDGRGWELVSPPDKHGAELLPIGEISVIQASAMGDAISYVAVASTEAEPAGRALETQVLSRRAAGGWESQDIAIPHETPTSVGLDVGEEYRYFSNDLSRAIVQPFGRFNPRLSTEASEQTLFLRTDFPSGEVGSPCLVSCYRPLVSGAPSYENVPSGTVFAGCSTRQCAPEFVGASPDLSHVVLWSGAALTEGAPERGLYEWSGGNLVLVSVLPNPNRQPVSVSNPAAGEADVARNAVSLDGSRVVWSDEQNHLYVRDTVREQTVQIGSGVVRFQTASSDGSKILFTQGEVDLRECDIVESEGELRCEITDLTAVGAGENPGVLGGIPGASDDAAYVYFVSNAMLKNNGVAVPGAQPGGCGSGAVIGSTCNLYVRYAGTTRLVAELSGIDEPDWWPSLSGLVARVSPDGRWLAFMSDRSLTGYDNRDGVTGKPDEEVYLYDALANGGTGRVVCASCNPTGARPRGVEYHRLEPGKGIAFGRIDGFFGSDPGIAANVPGWTAYAKNMALHQSRYLSDSGRLFFNSSDALVPQDSNGTGDVYEYEPAGVGDCTASSSTFSAVSGGCVGLISSGTSREESAFLDASENGSDVFFLSFAQLSHRDTDSIGDVYDARVGGGFAEAPSPPVCEGDACQSPMGAPEDPTPGSLTYNGPGNPSGLSSTAVVGKHKARSLSRAQKLAKALSACRRVRSKRVRVGCVLRAHRRYGRAITDGATTKRGKR
jgi:hypothetical protein